MSIKTNRPTPRADRAARILELALRLVLRLAPLQRPPEPPPGPPAPLECREPPGPPRTAP